MEQPANFTIDPDDKFYPGANTWMWNYCTFLGKFTNSRGEQFDLGIYLGGILGPSEATVYGNVGGDYYSGTFDHLNQEVLQAGLKDHKVYMERRIECYRRARLLNIVTDNKP